MKYKSLSMNNLNILAALAGTLPRCRTLAGSSHAARPAPCIASPQHTHNCPNYPWTGSKLVFLHGWGTHPVIWTPLLERLPGSRAVPLPGYASTAPAACADGLVDMANVIAQQLEPQTLLVGWSLGGLAAMRVALDYPQKVSRLMLIGATPCFVNRADWRHGVDDAVFAEFSRNLSEDYAGTIRRFLSLQAQGSDTVRAVLAELRKQLLAQPQPELTVLDAGLSMLRETDLRSELAGLTVPVSLVHGTGDKLAPVEAARWLQTALPNAALHEIKGAGHAPFLSHVQAVTDVIERWV